MDKQAPPLTAEEIEAAIQESKDYVKKHGGKSAEYFIRTPNGPRSADDAPTQSN